MGDTVTIDSNFTVAKLIVRNSALLKFDTSRAYTVVSNGDIEVNANGKIVPTTPFTSGGSKFHSIQLYGDLTVDGQIQFYVNGSVKGTYRIFKVTMKTSALNPNSVIQGTGLIETEYLQIDKALSSQQVKIQTGIAINVTYIYLYSGTVDNTQNNISTYYATRFDNASVFLARPNYRYKNGYVVYFGTSNITTGVELSDTVELLQTQSSTKVVSLHKNVVVHDQLSLSDGRINTNQYTLTVLGTVTNTGLSDKGFVIGTLKKPLTVKDTSVMFEIGTPKGYASARFHFKNIKNSGMISASTWEKFHPNIHDTLTSLKRYWTFSSSGMTFDTCSVILRYTKDDFVNGVVEKSDEQTLYGGLYTNLSWKIAAIGARDTSGAGGTVEFTDLTSFAALTLIKTANALSVHSETQSPYTYSLSQNYPNPFNPATTINYQIPTVGIVTLKVYDILGKEIASLVNEQKEAGNYTVHYDASPLTSGIYFYTLRSGSFSATKKFLFIK